jgi:hypothetical protein
LKEVELEKRKPGPGTKGGVDGWDYIARRRRREKTRACIYLHYKSSSYFY